MKVPGSATTLKPKEISSPLFSTVDSPINSNSSLVLWTFRDFFLKVAQSSPHILSADSQRELPGGLKAGQVSLLK